MASVGDSSPPSVLNYTDWRWIGASDNIVFQFDESIKRGSGDIKFGILDPNYIDVSRSDSNFDPWVSEVPITVEVSGSTLTVDPSIVLTVGQDYMDEFDENSILDLSGNDFNLIDGYTASIQGFTITVNDSAGTPPSTGDSTPPKVSNWGWGGVGARDNLVFQFDESITLGSGNIEFGIKDSNYNLVPTVPMTVEVSGSSLTIDPSYTLTDGERYGVRFYENSILDLSGNDFSFNSGYFTSFIEVSDDGTLYNGKTTNTAPTDIILDSSSGSSYGGKNSSSGFSIEENSLGAIVGSLSVTDLDANDTHTLTVSGYGSDQFEIVNSQLKLKSGVSADYETKSSYTLTVTATDAGGLSYSEDFSVSVTDMEETSPSTLNGTAGDDALDGFSGYDIIDGGEGLDTAKYSVSSDAVSFSANDSDQLVIEDSFEQSEALVDVERIQFTDQVYALDLNGNAGVAAKAIVASFGADSLSAYMSAALSVVDSGTSMESLCDLVVDLKLIDQLTGSSSNSSFVGHLFK
ncbi:MAG: hypothetical protein HOI10_09690, partial [Deltaproteobacteria bacterium]|nr:hypothetical protein [Deltaproteobacteria bacterium]